MEEALAEAKEREDEFWARHDISDEGAPDKVTDAYKAWVAAVELEYDTMGKSVRVHLDTPIARKAFILGYRAHARRTSNV